jgi:hypothetical protein
MPLGVDLAVHLRKQPSAPFLFVGSGISRRYLGLPNWHGLLQQLAKYLPRPLEYYLASADGNYPRTASLMAKDLHEAWWASGELESIRQGYEGPVTNSESVVKILASLVVSGRRAELTDEILLKELDLFRKAHIDGVITTNWDNQLEDIFPDYHVYVGQDELLFSHTEAIAEIYKIHGATDHPESLVFTENDYLEYEKKYPYLASKLLTIFVEHPVLFLGYSLSDENVVNILDSIATVCTTETQIEKLRDRLIFVQWLSDPSEEESIAPTIISSGGRRIPVTLVRVHNYIPVFEALASVRRRIPARILRHLKDHVYTLVKKQDPHGQIYVMDLDPNVDPREVEVVLGVGAIAKVSQVGYESVKRTDLFLEVIHSESRFDATTVVRKVLPRFLASGRHVPVFKYLQSAGYIDESGHLTVDDLDERVVTAAQATYDRFLPYAQYRAKEDEVKQNCAGIRDVVERYGLPQAYYYIPLLGRERINVTELHEFLKTNSADLTEAGHALNISAFRNVACLFDYLQYGPTETEPITTAH